MLNGLDDVDWTGLQGAYGPAEEVPDILRAMASEDVEVVDEGLFEFFSSVWHQGTVYTVTVAAVPFVVAMAVEPRVHRREHLLYALGGMCDPGQSDGRAQPAVAAAVAGHGAALAGLLDDPDADVREGAAYAVAWCGAPGREALLRRWPVEEHPGVRASLLMGLAMHDPRSVAGLARDAVGAPFPLPLAAALALVRTGADLPLEYVEPVAAALSSGRRWQGPWVNDPAGEIVDGVSSVAAAELTRRLAAESSAGRVRAAQAMADRFERSRSAAAELMPQLRVLLDDPDPAVVAAAVTAAAQAGVPAGEVADLLARIAVDGEGRTAEKASGILIRLGDPRWQEPVLAAWEAGPEPDTADGLTRLLSDHVPALTPELLGAVRRRLAAQVEAGLTGNPVISLANLLAAWGPEAAPAVTELTDALNAAPWAVCLALAAMGPAARPAVPSLRRMAAGRDQDAVRAAHAIWRLTGDTEPLVTAGAALIGARGRIAHDLELIADAGPDAVSLIPVLSRHLTGTAEAIFPDREDQVAAARVVWWAGRDAAPVLATLEAVLLAGDVPARRAVRLAGDMAPENGAALTPALGSALSNEWARAGAARALWLHGAPRSELLEPLLAALKAPRGDQDALRVLTEMRAVEALPVLRGLAEADARLPTIGLGEAAWRDDRAKAALLATIRTLEETRPSWGPCR